MLASRSTNVIVKRVSAASWERFGLRRLATTTKLEGAERSAALSKLSEGGGPFVWEDVSSFEHIFLKLQ